MPFFPIGISSDLIEHFVQNIHGTENFQSKMKLFTATHTRVCCMEEWQSEETP